MSADDFTPLKVIGRGAFGEVKNTFLFFCSSRQTISIFILGSSCTKT
jgi:hypothetical protein